MKFLCVFVVCFITMAMAAMGDEIPVLYDGNAQAELAVLSDTGPNQCPPGYLLTNTRHPLDQVGNSDRTAASSDRNGNTMVCFKMLPNGGNVFTDDKI